MQISRMNKRTGTSPGRLLQTAEANITVHRFNRGSYSRIDTADPEILESLPEKEPDGNLWIEIHGTGDSRILQILGRNFGLHPLTLEDIQNYSHRPQLEKYRNCTYISLQRLSSSKPVLKFRKINMIITPGILITVCAQDDVLFPEIYERLASDAEILMDRDAGYLAYEILDTEIDRYLDHIEEYEKQILGLEDLASYGKNEKLTETLYRLKKQLSIIRWWLRPLKEHITTLARSGEEILGRDASPLLSDLVDHLTRAMDLLDLFSVMAADMLTSHMNLLSLNMNRVMKLLTVITSVFIPLTFITGIYGMNFIHMPELAVRWAYPAVLIVLSVIAASMLIWFKRKKWL